MKEKVFISLADKDPELAKQWHPTKNGNLTAEMVSSGSDKKVWWWFPYDDPFTGKHFDFEWKATIKNRIKTRGCPFLSGRKLWVGFNDLTTRNLTLAKQWHPTKNGKLTPEMVMEKSRMYVWWYLPYDDPITSKHFDFEWQARIIDRSNGVGCPFIAGKRAWPGFNDLATKNPKLAAQWHPTKNGDLTPKMVTAFSNKKVWWLLPYDDPITGKHYDFVWQAKISGRSVGNGCPFLSGQEVWLGFNDLATRNPELAAQWHPTKNGDLTPEMVTEATKESVWWLYSYDDPLTGKHFDFEWEASVVSRYHSKGCPFLSGRSVWPGFNDLATRNPDLAAQWHPTKNGDLTPEMVTEATKKHVWWLYPYDDPITGKHFDFEWKAQICNRNKGAGCPFLSGKAVWPGFNDLATINPELALQLHPTKNGDLTAEQILAGSNKRVWWLYPYDDPITGKHFDFEWKAIVNMRNFGSGCPFLNGAAVWPGFNDLATRNPELAAQWHPTKNGDLTPQMVTEYSMRKVWWMLPYDDPITGKHFDFEWKASIESRNSGNGCPYLSGTAVWEGFNDLETLNHELAIRWHPKKNRTKKPTQFTVNSDTKVWWMCLVCENEWRASIKKRNCGAGCPVCGNW